ncbi:uncharacterized protein MONOS_4729 [Monocercomonoides exilis]|uniref:uncharacterized protein n=1 Tax=Monocercomonoides exilis TaxID=2049356 RepID=UPI003559A4A6|nr:hypothetical protein MONOS_4729 [Monocercomonoides exilis]|eukprot:MONOS_4729.1-p1 / transcript=MONOS_4729.1 / gene=MONOS_4729 / organism=Monocercomonoides_exilis_PA203 / gene_product=unspecified product / transcript_product=unspecified product / location=Mono_scaffold00129:93979-94547(-) / protein_length=168 / sequence_SO=supercontig / SO=protein_coding / is_pseudo=false
MSSGDSSGSTKRFDVASSSAYASSDNIIAPQTSIAPSSASPSFISNDNMTSSSEMNTEGYSIEGDEQEQLPKKKLGPLQKSSVSHLITVKKDGVSIQIPPSLLLLPSDTDAQRASKKKKLHSLHCLARAKQEELDSRKQQSNWLQFKKKLESKKGKKKKSHSDSVFM